MNYAWISLLALLLLLITNYDVLFALRKPRDTAVEKIYRCYLWAVAFYYLTDILWGVLDALSLTALLYIDTELYFLAMALGILLWTRYVVAYLEVGGIFHVLLPRVGILFFAGVCLMAAVNPFFPTLFWLDERGGYHASAGRYFSLLVQVVILLLTSAHALSRSTRTGNRKRNRYVTIGLFGLIMAVLIAVQYLQPYLPLYAMGYMLGCGLLRTFVIENEREEYRHDLELALRREQEELDELNAARRLAYTDPLTGAKSRLAYAEKEDALDKAIAEGALRNLAVVVFDVNGLKEINDTQGHKAGDRHILAACDLIRQVFPPDSVYRIGGDEFVAILEGQDYESREELFSLFQRRVEENQRKGKVVVASGMVSYRSGRDNSTRRVFERADSRMYQRKDQLKRVS